MKYTVIFKPSVTKQIRRFSKKEQIKIITVVENLAADPRPHGYKKLVDQEGLFRVRVGNYRIIYEIHDKVLQVIVLRVADRREAY
ncbi:MAG: type II toxin-antitoxin system RelE/ParE family toxin [Pyrinomonadaceae bacterium]